VKNKKNDLKLLTELLNEQQADNRISRSFDILRASGLLDKLLDIGYHSCKLKTIQIRILSVILANGGTITPTEVKAKIFRSNNAISKTLDNLDKLGLTRSSHTKVDRRLRKVTLTEKGLTTLKIILPIRANIFIQATNNLTEEELEALEPIIQKIIDNLMEIIGRGEKNKPEKLFF
jgi:DNA-binding MarR family transcriptional regulator